ncbi:putative F-box protein At1g47790 [Bidens hawaiensis]|uniref:putative F-box protein At1g47790 n=1 Tax=Bidens hawaiensis TaxID=980011 RepID=UPI0040495289
MEVVLPSNILSDIFLRLPLKSIMLCKCVCKYWRDLITDPYFVHLHISTSHESLILHEFDHSDRYGLPGTLQWIDIIQHQPNNKYYLHYIKNLNLDRCTDNFRGSPVLVGSVNGLIACFRPDGCICILNPVLEEYIILPRPTIKYWCPILYGFGVSKAGEYKVIRITGRTEVYTLGTPAWRDLGERTYPIQQRPGHMYQRRSDGVFLNGHVYSLCGREIYDFDLDTETLELFPISPLVHAGFKDLMLGVLKGRLSLLSWSSFELEVWVMKEENWCKEIDMLMFGLLSWSPLRLMDGLKGTCNLMLCDQAARRLIMWCLDTNTIQQVDMQGKFGELMVYRPSFIKLDNFVSWPFELRKVYETMNTM